MARSDISLAEQFERRKNWRRPLVDSVVATVLHRRADSPLSASIFDVHEFLVVERLKGAEQGQFQAHHGGFVDMLDGDIFAAASRESFEETGYDTPSETLRYLFSVGPAIYRSELDLRGGNPVPRLILQISNEEAEPTVGFTLPIFIADVTGKKPVRTIDQEVSAGRWLTCRQIVDEFGNKVDVPYSKFNYFQILFSVMHYLADPSRPPGQRPAWKPGEYVF